MKHIKEFIKEREKGLEQKVNSFMQHQPYLGAALLAVGIPVGILVLVSVIAMAAALPVAYFMGWL